MYWKEDIIFELNNALVDLYTYNIYWDFVIKTFNNQIWDPTATIISPITTATSYTLNRNIRRIIDFKFFVDNLEKKDGMNWYKKYGQFSNRNNTSLPVYEYTYSWNTITLSESNDIEVVYMVQPKTYTSKDYDDNVEIEDIPNDFQWVLTDMVMSNMTVIFLSDGAALSDRYFNKSETRMKRLAEKYGHKYANAWIWVVTPWKWHSNFIRDNWAFPDALANHAWY